MSDPAGGARVSPRATATLVMLLLFLAGLVVGAAGDRMLIRSRGRGFGMGGRPSFASRGGPPADISKAIADRLGSQLLLTPLQTVRVDSVLKQQFGLLGAIREEVRPRIAAIHAQTDQEIEKLLTPDQVTRFHALRAEERARGGRGGRGPRGDPAAPPSP